MSREEARIERISAFGRFERQPSLPALDSEVGAFVTRHELHEPLSFRPTKREQGGSANWFAEIELHWADFRRILEKLSFPIAAEWTMGETDGEECLIVEVTLRSGRLRASVAKDALDSKMTPAGLLIATSGRQDRTIPKPSGQISQFSG